MSLDIASRLKVLLASAPRNIRSIQTLEIGHSAMSQTWFLWREPYQGTILTESGFQTVVPVNLQIQLAGAEGHLDQNFKINIDTTDIADIFRGEIDRIPVNTSEKIRCVYREYMSDDLATIVAEANLQVEDITWTIGAATFTAASPRYNMLRTGELYVPRDVPMLRGFL